MMTSIVVRLSAAAFALAGVTAPDASHVNGGGRTTAKLSVVATTPDLAALAREIGGDLIEVKALAKPTEDPHFVDAKPSHIVTLNRASVLIDGGAELELGWLPALLESARNDKIATGAPGRVSASTGIHLVDVPTTFDRSRGDVHALGNPHFLTDPLNAKIVAANIAAHFSQVDPRSAATYAANLKKFNAALDAKLGEWQTAMAPYKGAKIVTYHKDFPYFASRFGLQVVENLEPKPGIAPSPAHLAAVIERMKSEKVHVILVQPFQNRKTAETVARQVAGIVLDVSQQPGTQPAVTTYLDAMDLIVRTVAGGLAQRK